MASFKLELTIEDEWFRIGSVRHAVKHYADAVFPKSEVGRELAIVATELLENAMKYGEGGSVSFSLTRESENVVIRVSNTVSSGSDHRNSLRNQIAWIGSFQNPIDAYAAALKRSSEQKSNGASSGLGLVRIVCEGDCVLDCNDSTPVTVVVRATRKMTAGQNLSLPVLGPIDERSPPSK